MSARYRWSKMRALCLAAAGLAALLSAGARPARSQPAPAHEQALTPESTVSLDFDNADIRAVIKHISDLTGRNFLVDEKVRGKVTIITPTRLRVRDVYPVFLSILHTYGFTAVAAGEVTKIMPVSEVARSGLPTIAPGEVARLRDTDRFVTSIVQLAHADAGALAAVLRPMVAREGNLVPYPLANALIITDTEANVRRLSTILAALDVPSDTAIVEVARLKYALAKDMAATLEKLLEEEAGARAAAPRVPVPRRPPSRRGVAGAERRQAIRVIPEERVNALIIMASPEDMVRARSLVKKLDVPPPPELKQIHVYRLENAVAEDLAAVLNQQIQAQAQSSQATSSRTGARTPAARPAPAPPPGGAASPAGAPLLSDVSITPDKATNSLIIRASPEDYDALTEIIRQLDVRRSQVLVEGLIAEMTLEKAARLGVEWRSRNVPTASGTSVVGGTNFPPAGQPGGVTPTFATGPFGGPPGLVLGLARGLITFGDQTFFDVRGLIHAFQEDQDINVLSTPQILTSDNEEAEIIVGENRPFVTQSQTTAEGSTVQNFEFRDVGVTLRITPHISPNRFVRLKIFLEITGFVAESSQQVGAVTTTKRTATTSVTVEDTQTVVIGGLIRDDKVDVVDKVPLLGDIPLLGYLFKSKTKQKTKTNLLIFITPRTVFTPEEHRQLTDLKRNQANQPAPERPRSPKERM